MDIQLLKAIGKGLLTYFPFVNTYLSEQKRTRLNHSGSNALFCYTLWMKILNFHIKNNLPIKFESIAEIGTGGSMGLGFCALLTGTKSYSVLEIEKYNNTKQNLQLFLDILELFKSNLKVPNCEYFDQINIKIDDIQYYNQIIEPPLLVEYLRPSRIHEIQENIKGVSSTMIRSHYNWENDLSLVNRFDFVFSRAVMEHVNSPEKVYKSINSILRTNGLMLHDIEFHSHGITKTWNGHIRLSNFIWEIIKGKRPYSLNRIDYYTHCRIIENNNFKIINEIIVTKQIEKEVYGAAILSKKSSDTSS